MYSLLDYVDHSAMCVHVQCCKNVELEGVCAIDCSGWKGIANDLRGRMCVVEILSLSDIY